MDGWTRHDTERFLLLIRECAKELKEIKEELRKGNDGSRKTDAVTPED